MLGGLQAVAVGRVVERCGEPMGAGCVDVSAGGEEMFNDFGIVACGGGVKQRIAGIDPVRDSSRENGFWRPGAGEVRVFGKQLFYLRAVMVDDGLEQLRGLVPGFDSGDQFVRAGGAKQVSFDTCGAGYDSNV